MKRIYESLALRLRFKVTGEFSHSTIAFETGPRRRRRQHNTVKSSRHPRLTSNGTSKLFPCLYKATTPIRIVSHSFTRSKGSTTEHHRHYHHLLHPDRRCLVSEESNQPTSRRPHHSLHHRQVQPYLSISTSRREMAKTVLRAHLFSSSGA
jgi:hypothetical protein